MDALDVAKVWLRRWYLTLPVLVLAVTAGMQLANQQATQYHASASFALIYSDTNPRSPTAPDPRDQNPLAFNGGSLLGEALLADFRTPEEQRALGGPGVSGTAPGQPVDHSAFTVSLPLGSLTYTVETYGSDREQVRSVVERVLKAAPVLAQAMQDRAGAPLNSRYEPFVTAPTQVVAMPATSPAKLLVGFAGVGLAAGAALALVADRLLARRAERRSRKRTDQSVSDVPVLAEPLIAPTNEVGRQSLRDRESTGAASEAASPPWGNPDEFRREFRLGGARNRRAR